MVNDSGLLSIDFLAGFTIFMIAFIMVLTMISGYFVGLQSHTIDYDAVAYRTGVILAEDPGYSESGQTAWEINDKDHTGNILRLGLAYSDDPLGFSRNNPNILSSTKINKFFNTSYFPTPQEYRDRLIFGDRSYNFNISLRSMDGYSYNNFTTDSTPQQHGYIRRVVKIREPGVTQIDAVSYYDPISTDRNFTILLDFKALYSKSPPYMIDPLQEPIVINITNFAAIGGVKKLSKVELFESGVTNPTLLKVYIDSSPTATSQSPLAPATVTDSILLILTPDPYFRTAGQNSKFTIHYTFDPASNGLNKDISDFSPEGPRFIPAVLEVKIW